jgi:hypothetical protein
MIVIEMGRPAPRFYAGEGNAVRLPDGEWHVSYDLAGDDKAVAATSVDLFEAVAVAQQIRDRVEPGGNRHGRA